MKEMRAQKCKDIEITFVGMAFLVEGALDVIKAAIDVVTNEVEVPQCIWIIQPWKVTDVQLSFLNILKFTPLFPGERTKCGR